MDGISFVRWCEQERTSFVLSDRIEFTERIERDRVDRYERLEFHLVIHCTGRRGVHEVDFERVELIPGRALYVQPGQVHRLSTGAEAEYDAHFVSFPVAPNGVRPVASGVHLVDLDASQLGRLDLLYEFSRRRPERREPADVFRDDAALRDLAFAAFGFDPDAGPSVAVGVEQPEWATTAFGALRADLEVHLRAGETVQDRAGRLGYSTRTLDRACRAVVGTNAKQVCDERLALEARRMLSLPDATSSGVASHLGFTEPTNFTKFLKRTTGSTPTALMAA